MKSIKARLNNRFRKHLEMDKPSSSNSNRMSRSTSNCRNPPILRSQLTAVEFQDAATATSTRQRLFWGNRRASTAVRDDKSKPDSNAAGKKKPPASTRQSNFTQTDRSRTHRKLSVRSTRCNSMATTALVSRENMPETPGNRRPDDMTARCSALHEGRKLLQERLMVRVDALFNMLFSASPFLQNFHDKRKSTDLRMGAWARNAGGQNQRTVSMTVALQANVGPKIAKVTETQTMRECSEPGQLYSIDVRSVNAEIPYADTFVVLMHFCLKATVEEQTDVLIFAQIQFLKSVWAVVRTFIEKNTYAGLEEFCQALYSALLIEIRKK
ncbi:GRAM domain-containing protein 1B [Drosophila erecta]|uniref:GRAM domain-containing protein 1B n=1 Tax=Drosophila erecta TaxID=7220 RepID=UPI0001780B4B|nr:GRAM domain-containing protein 1B [Drosophila erecta]